MHCMCSLLSVYTVHVCVCVHGQVGLYILGSPCGSWRFCYAGLCVYTTGEFGFAKTLRTTKERVKNEKMMYCRSN